MRSEEELFNIYKEVTLKSITSSWDELNEMIKKTFEKVPQKELLKSQNLIRKDIRNNMKEYNITKDEEELINKNAMKWNIKLTKDLQIAILNEYKKKES